jgi:GNAT superfamily N-acetyltransferase
MPSSYLRLTAEARPRAEDISSIENAIYRYNMAATNDWAYCRVAYFLRDDADRIHGGVLGGVWGGWMRLEFLWVAEGLRGQGFGTQLLEAAEQQARDKGCRGMILQTHSFQARSFYERFGYEVVGEIPDYPVGHAYYMMRKLFNPESASSLKCETAIPDSD